MGVNNLFGSGFVLKLFFWKHSIHWQIESYLRIIRLPIFLWQLPNTLRLNIWKMIFSVSQGNYNKLEVYGPYGPDF